MPIPVIAMRCMPRAMVPGVRAAQRTGRRSFNYRSAHDGGGHRRACARPAGQSAARGRALELRAAGSRGLAGSGRRVRRRARRRARQLVRDGQRRRRPARRAASATSTRSAWSSSTSTPRACSSSARSARWDPAVLVGQRVDGAHGRGARARRHGQGRAPPPQRGGAQARAAGARPLGRHRRERRGRRGQRACRSAIRSSWRRRRSSCAARRLASRALDNRLGALVVLEAARRAAAAGDLKAEVVAVASVREETSYAGARTAAFAVEPDVAITLDVTHTDDYPNSDQARVTGSRALGSGPSISRGAAQHEGVAQRLIAVAARRGHPAHARGRRQRLVDRQRGRAGGARGRPLRARRHSAALHALAVGDLRSARRRARNRAGCALLPQPRTRRGLDTMTSYSAAEQVLEEGKRYALDIDTSHGPINAVLDPDLGGPIPNSIAFLAEQGLLRRPLVPPRRARLRAPGRLPERHRHRQSRATRSSARRRASTSTRSAISRWPRRASRPPGASGSQFFVISGKSGEGLPAEYGILGHARDEESLATIKAIDALGRRRRPAQRARPHQLDDAARDHLERSSARPSNVQGRSAA